MGTDAFFATAKPLISRPAAARKRLSVPIFPASCVDQKTWREPQGPTDRLRKPAEWAVVPTLLQLMAPTPAADLRSTAAPSAPSAASHGSNARGTNATPRAATTGSGPAPTPSPPRAQTPMPVIPSSEAPDLLFRAQRPSVLCATQTRWAGFPAFSRGVCPGSPSLRAERETRGPSPIFPVDH